MEAMVSIIPKTVINPKKAPKTVNQAFLPPSGNDAVSLWYAIRDCCSQSSFSNRESTLDTSLSIVATID